MYYNNLCSYNFISRLFIKHATFVATYYFILGKNLNIFRGCRVAGAEKCDCKSATVVDSVLTRRNELLIINIFISSLWYQGKTRR